MAGGVGNIEADALDAQPVAIRDAHRHDIDAGLFTHHCDAARAVAQSAETGDVVGMQMGIDRLHQLQVQLPDELKVAIDLLEDGIDDQRLAATAGGEQIGVRARRRLEELTEDHNRLPRSCQGKEFTLPDIIHAKLFLLSDRNSSATRARAEIACLPLCGSPPSCCLDRLEIQSLEA